MVTIGGGKKNIRGRKADIWAAGMTLYILATNQQHPFATANGPLDLTEKIKNFEVNSNLIDNKNNP